MCSADKRTKFSRKQEQNLQISQIPTLKLTLKENNITNKDLQNGLDLFDKVAKCLHTLNMKLPPLYLNVPLESYSTEESEILLILQRMRKVAISLLNTQNENVKVKPRSEKRKRMDNNVAVKHLRTTDTKCANSKPIFITETSLPKNNGSKFLHDLCYICKKLLNPIDRHSFHSWMCVPCGDFNFKKRSQTAPLNGKVALVTGARVKIGYEIALKLLRAGADRVILTTRFPLDALKRYQKEADFSEWAAKLDIYQLDLRFLQDVIHFCEHVTKNYAKLDILIQNAAQTIRRPAAYYKSLIEGESTLYLSNCDVSGIIKSYNGSQFLQNAQLSALTKSGGNDEICVSENRHPSANLVHPDDYKYSIDVQKCVQDFPPGQVDDDGQQLDLRRENTWTLRLGKVETVEMVEVTAVNYMAPYLLLQKLTPLMKRSDTETW